MYISYTLNSIYLIKYILTFDRWDIFDYAMQTIFHINVFSCFLIMVYHLDVYLLCRNFDNASYSFRSKDMRKYKPDSIWFLSVFMYRSVLRYLQRLGYLLIFSTILKKFSKYLIPIKICSPLIFAYLACAKIKGSKLAQNKRAKIKGRRKKAKNEWTTCNFEVKEGYSKIKRARNLRVREN